MIYTEYRDIRYTDIQRCIYRIYREMPVHVFCPPFNWIIYILTAEFWEFFILDMSPLICSLQLCSSCL